MSSGRVLVHDGDRTRVFSAHDITLQRRVAIKELRFVTNDEQALTAAVLAALLAVDHTNVQRVFRYHNAAHMITVTAEYCDGGSLLAYLRSKAPLHAAQQRAWALHIASGLRALHLHNIMHLDVAVRNVLLTKEQLIAKVSRLLATASDCNNLNSFCSCWHESLCCGTYS